MIRKQCENKFIFKNKKYKLIGVLKKAHKNLTLSFRPFYAIKEKSLTFIFVNIDDCLIPFNISLIQAKNDKEFLISFKRVNNFYIDILKNKEVYVEEKDYSKVLFPKEELLDLIGFKVIDEEGNILGNVTELDGNILQKSIKVKKENGEDVYIPLVDAFIKKIDKKKKEIILDDYSKILL